MRGMAVLSCALVLGLGAATAGADGVVPVEGPWHATTSAGLPVGFEVSGAQIVSGHFGFRWGFCGTFESGLLPSFPIEPNGHWIYLDPRGTSIEGTFVAADRAEGTVTAPARMLPGCPETHASFVAVPGPAPPEPEAVVVNDVRTGHHAASPAKMVLARDGHLTLYGLRWSGFGEPVARATGHAYLRHGCRRCPRREARRPRVSVWLEDLTPERGLRAYLRVRYRFRGAIPRGFFHHGSQFLH
jgi:hypothetical protein